MAPGSAPAPPEARGEGPHSSSSSLTSSLDGRRVSPSDPWLPWLGRGESSSEIGSVSLSLSVSAFSDSALAPFLLYLEIHNSDWIETFAQIFFQKLSFLRPKKGINRLTRAQGGWGRAHLEWAWALSHGHLGHRLALILLPKNHKYSKIILHPFLSRLDSFDMGFLRNIKHATNRNWH